MLHHEILPSGALFVHFHIQKYLLFPESCRKNVNSENSVL